VRSILVAGLVLAVFVVGEPVQAQTGSPFNERDDQYRLLGLKRAKQAFEMARESWERKSRLHEKGMLADDQLDAARQIRNEAEVNYQQSMLAVLFEQQYVAVLEAVKLESVAGKKRIKLRLENTSGGGAEYRHLLPTDDGLFKTLRPEIVHDVYVSLANEEGAIISQPYEAKIEELRYGHPADLWFELLQDVEAITVNLAYGHNSQRSVKVFLQKDVSSDRVAVQSQQFAQEVELGSSATYDLTLELFSGVSDTFKLMAVNLPAQINRHFVDPGSQARISQFKFTESSRTRRAALKVSLPDRAGDELPTDEPIPFYVLAVPRRRVAELALDGRRMEPSAIEALGVGWTRLELVPRGVGRLIVRVPQLFYSIEPSAVAEVTLELINDGTRRLDNIEVTAEPPHLWSKQIEPPLVAALGVGEERRVTLRFEPPAGVAPGKYEIRVRSSSFSDDQPILGDDKTIAVEVRPEVTVLGPALIALVLMAMIIGVVVAGVRLAHR